MKDELINKIQSVKWQKMVSRSSALLFSSICAEAFKYTNDSFGFEWPVKNRLVLGDGQLYHSRDEIKLLEKEFISGGGTTYKKFLANLKKHIEGYEKKGIEMDTKEYEHYTTAELGTELESFLHSARLAHNFLTSMPVAEKLLADKLRKLLPGNEDEKDMLVDQLTFGRKFGELMHEDESFFYLAKAYEDGSDDYQQKLDEHVRKFGWVGTRSYRWDKAWTKSDIEKRIMSFFVMGDKPDEKIKNHEEFKQKAALNRDKAAEKLGIKADTKDARLVELISDYSYARKWRTDIIYCSGYRARGLFYEIALRANMVPNMVVWMSVDEIRSMLKDGRITVRKREINKRKNYFAHIMIGGKIDIISGLGLQNKLDKLMSAQKTELDLIKFKGSCTCPGIVKGRVKIIKRMEDIDKIEIGDIMVSTMTFPNFVSAMEKAAAFITDEGGILSHAAIVSREMKKPCITGTFVGTKVLKDGDMVEVDANKGIVKKI